MPVREAGPTSTHGAKARDGVTEPTVEVHLTPPELRAALRRDVSAGLTSSPKELPPKWFYDARGCELFDDITRLPEYYPTRCERSILGERAPEIARLSGADTFVELGSCTSETTRLLLAALAEAGRLRRIVAFDVSEPTLRSAAASLAREYPQAEVRAVVGDFEHLLRGWRAGGARSHPPRPGPRPGGTRGPRRPPPTGGWAR